MVICNHCQLVGFIGNSLRDFMSHIWPDIYGRSDMDVHICTFIYGHPYMYTHIWTSIYERPYMVQVKILCRQNKIQKKFGSYRIKLKGRIRPYMNHMRAFGNFQVWVNFGVWHVYGGPYMDMSVYGSIYEPLFLCDVWLCCRSLIFDNL